MDGELELWRAVIRQAIKDATGKNKLEKPYALKWIFGDGRDFNLVCEFADVLPHKVREEVCNRLKII